MGLWKFLLFGSFKTSLNGDFFFSENFVAQSILRTLSPSVMGFTYEFLPNVLVLKIAHVCDHSKCF